MALPSTLFEAKPAMKPIWEYVMMLDLKLEPKLERFFPPLPERPELGDNEEILREGLVLFSRFGPSGGNLTLTNRRLIWNQTVRPLWPMKPAKQQVELKDVVAVEKGTLLDLVLFNAPGGGVPWCLRLRNGKTQRIWADGRQLDEWVVAIQKAVARLDTV